MSLAATALVARGDRRRIRAFDARLDAEPLTPAAGRILEHASVVERVLRGIEFAIAPDATELARPFPPRLAGREIDARSASRGNHVKHLLVGLPAFDPALHDLDPLERRPGAGPGAGILLRRDGEGRNLASRPRLQIGTHRDAARIALAREVASLAKPLVEIPASEEADDGPGPARAVRLAPLHRIE